MLLSQVQNEIKVVQSPSKNFLKEFCDIFYFISFRGHLVENMGMWNLSSDIMCDSALYGWILELNRNKTKYQLILSKAKLTLTR